MSTLNLLKLQKIAILKIGTTEYIQVVETPVPNYTHQPSNTMATPTVFLLQMSADESITIDPTDYINDSNNPVISYPKIVGPRPKNIVRR